MSQVPAQHLDAGYPEDYPFVQAFGQGQVTTDSRFDQTMYIICSYSHIVCVYMSNYARDFLKSLRCMRLQDKAIQQHAE